MKAEGGWGVVCTGYVSVHPSSDDSPLPYATLWDENDMRSHALMTDAVHAHGSLAGHRALARRRIGFEQNDAACRRCRRRASRGWRRTSASWAISARKSWTAPTSAICCAGRRKRPARQSAPASTSSTYMPAWAICRTSSCFRNGTAARDAYGGSRCESRAHRARAH